MLQSLLIEAFGQTAAMVGIAALVSLVLGLPLALLLLVTGTGHIAASPWVNRPVGLAINAVRSVPFIILIVAIVPFTRLLVGTSIGTAATPVG